MPNENEVLDPLDEVFDLEDDGYHTDEPEEESKESGTETEEPGAEPHSEPDSGETTDEVTNDEAEETPAEGEQEAEKPDSESGQQFITVKYDSETRQISMEDAPSLIQKGLNYDRMQERMEAAERETETLRAAKEQIDQQVEILSTLEMIAQVVGTSIPEMLEQLHVNAYKGTGKTEAEARAIIKADKLERQLKSQGKAPSQEASTEDARTQQVARELEEFRKQYPNVNLNDTALVERLRPYIQSGMSLTTAYLKQENERQAAEIVRLQQEQQQKEAAREQNKKNRANAPGSMKDSGGSRDKDLADLFEEELFR